MRRRLYFQIYAGFLVVALLCAELTLGVFVGERWWQRGGPSAGAAQQEAPLAQDPVNLRNVQVFVLLLLVSIAIGAFPMARRITRRLERLRSGVEELSTGALSSRVPVEGEDEVAALARSFNRAAERIERLVETRRRMLASASHELRTPLTRIRLGLELLGSEGERGALHPEREKLLEDLERDVEELDALIGDLLLATRLEAQPKARRLEPVELLALVEHEAARFGVAAAGDRFVLHGERDALRRMVRNLLDNAQRWGGGRDVEARVEALSDGPPDVRVAVTDRGPGLPAEERERIFEPFYRPRSGANGGEAGVGLGLALVLEVARRHDGDARCLAREGGGLCFEVDLRDADPAGG